MEHKEKQYVELALIDARLQRLFNQEDSPFEKVRIAGPSVEGLGDVC